LYNERPVLVLKILAYEEVLQEGIKMGRMFFAVIIVGGLLSTSICFGYSDGSGTAEEPYQIANKEDLLTLAGTVADYNKCFSLTADIDMEGQVFTRAIIAADTNSSSGFQGTDFRGTFDGNNHKITNFTINGGSNDYLGLFGQINRGMVRNLGLENFFSGSISSYSGGLAGYNYGYIIACYSTGGVYGSDYVGGLVGDNSGIISDCYSTGAVSGGFWVGGLVGRNKSSYGGISNCYSTGTVSGSVCVGGLVGYIYYYGSVSDCYSTGAVSGNTNVGGLVGYNYGGTVNNSFWDKQTSGRTTSAGGTGKTTAQMKTITTFTSAGWDFLGETANGREDIWRMCVNGLYYPKLSWQFLLGDFICPDGVEMNDLAVLCEEWLFEEIPADVWPEGGDGIVNFLDWAVFANQWQITVDFDGLADFADQWLKTGANYYIADIAPDGGDGIVNMLDFAVFANDWLQQD
jgi:hypothetical protein